MLAPVCFRRLNSHAPVAQRIEHLTTDQKVWGSNPYRRTKEIPALPVNCPIADSQLDSQFLIGKVNQHLPNFSPSAKPVFPICIGPFGASKIINNSRTEMEQSGVAARESLFRGRSSRRTGFESPDSNGMSYPSKVQQMNKVLYTIPQVADMANVSKSTIYREIAANRLQAILVRSKMRIANDAFDAYIQMCKKKQSVASLTGGLDDQ